MFEHLGPIPETKTKRGMKNFKTYLSFLFLAVLIFTFTLGFSRGPGSSASNYKDSYLFANLIGNYQDKNIAIDQPSFSAFDFILNIDKPGVSIYKFKLHVDGIYSLDSLEDLNLYHNGVQLGETKLVDQEGFIHFDLNDYKLPAGQNEFNLIFSSNRNLKLENVFEFGIRNPQDIVLNYQGHFLTPEADFPISSGILTFTEKGYISAYNNFINKQAVIIENIPQMVAGFSLADQGETADLKKVVLSYDELEEEQDLEGVTFVLVHKNKPYAQADILTEENKIVFNFSSPVVLKGKKPFVFQVHTFGLPKGAYSFSLHSVQAKGYASGQELSLKKELPLSTLHTISYYPEFKNGDFDTRLSLGWNKLYEIKVKAKGTEFINIHKLSWVIDSLGIDIKDAEIWVNNNFYIADTIIENGKLTVKTSWAKPLVVGKESTTIQLLVKAENIQKEARIEAYLAEDKKPMSEDFQGNIIWSVGDNFSNSYLLPFLPLDPSVLAN